VSLCFLTRSVIVALGTSYNLSSYWWFDGVYYFFLEQIPLTLMLRILHEDRRRKMFESETPSLIGSTNRKTRDSETTPILAGTRLKENQKARGLKTVTDGV